MTDNLSKYHRIIRVEITKNLSAMGSKKLPNIVTKFLFLAICPSRKSVNDAKMNSKTAIHDRLRLNFVPE